MANRKAMTAVAKAVKNGELPHISSQVCVDCGKPAEHYDHRDYDKPLDVNPVCRPCNRKRGPAIGVHDGLYQVNLDDQIHEMLVEISEYRRQNGNLIRTNKDIIADLIMAAHIRMKREQKKAPELFEGTNKDLSSLGDIYTKLRE